MWPPLCLAGLLAAGHALPAAAQDAAYVESVTGRVVALVGGKPTLLGELDTIGAGTRIDLLANSELQVCHYQQQKIVALKGPLRASVAQAGITTDGGKPIEATAETCAKPATSTFQGGVLARATVPPTTKVALRPMLDRRSGTIVNTSSVSGLAGDWGLAAYTGATRVATRS